MRAAAPLTYIIHHLKPGAAYAFKVNGKTVKKIRSDAKGDCTVAYRPAALSATITVTPAL